ncbi:sensor histidine kinase [Robertmurraya mangrovi]|uniref:sensor histidine kinase n=1 Tax=Robertmurraya mangrovi TaxID=3098077 RepID=UPI002ACC0092|nr:HAMP domain-containing sensor histidine kinase [Bacillus sp. 31A1R]
MKLLIVFIISILAGVGTNIFVARINPNPYLSIIGFIVFYTSFYLLTQIKILQLERLSRGFQEVKEGNLHYRAKVKGKDEISQLANQMNEMMDQLKKSQEEEKRLQTFKTELITNVSHDIRTPLTSVIGYLSLLQHKKDLSLTEQSEYVKIAHKKAEQLSILLDDLFEFTKLSNRDLPIQIEEIMLNQLMEQLLDEYEPIFKSNQMMIRKEIEHHPIFIFGDAQRLVRLFENLFRNSMEHGNTPGELYVKLSLFEDQVKIQLENDGEPLTEEECEYIFDRFYKKDESRSKGKGSGLGLAISKEIVELHNGKIYAQSNNGKLTIVILFPTVRETLT